MKKVTLDITGKAFKKSIEILSEFLALKIYDFQNLEVKHCVVSRKCSILLSELM
jgi:hypothetical protein